MRKSTILCAALAMAALSLTSCQKEEKASNQKFFASFEQAGNGKVSLDQNLNMYWYYDDGSNIIGVATFAEGGNIDQLTNYHPSSISDDGRTAVLEYCGIWYDPFEEGTQGPFYATTKAISIEDMTLNGNTLHLPYVSQTPNDVSCVMPMVARADDFGQLQFKHIAGVLKMLVNLPDGYRVNDVRVTNVYDDGGYECDVEWDADGNITVRYAAANMSWNGDSFAYVGEGFYYLPMPVGDWTGLTFEVEATNEEEEPVTFRKAMSASARIRIERAGISTVTLNYTEDDLVE